MREALLQELCQVAITAARSAGEIIQTHVNQEIVVSRLTLAHGFIAIIVVAIGLSLFDGKPPPPPS